MLVMAKPENLQYSNVGMSMWLGYPVEGEKLVLADCSQSQADSQV